MKADTTRTLWHRLLGKLLELLLTPVGVSVLVDFPLMSDPPRADILLLRRDSPTWTEAQRACLADGLRDTTASHVLLELKYTESLTGDRLAKVHGYDIFYRVGQKLSEEEVASFILSAKTPQSDLLAYYGYQPTRQAGVYESRYPLEHRVRLIILNELSPSSHNAYLKLFASRQLEKQKAFGLLQSLQTLSQPLWSYLVGLRKVMLPPKGVLEMSQEITPEYILQLGEEIRQSALATYTINEILAHYKPDEVLAHYKPDEVLAHYKPDEVLAHYKPDEVLAHYKPDEVLAHYQGELAARDQSLTRQLMLKTWQRTLQLRFKLSPETLISYREQAETLSLEALDQLNEQALLAASLVEFEQEFRQLITNQA